MRFLLLSLALVFSQDIVGKWYTQSKEAIVEINRNGSQFQGSIVWLKEPKDEKGNIKLDRNNPEVRFRETPIKGLVILKSFVKESDSKYSQGFIYDPKTGKTYNSTLTLENPNTLIVKGYIGLSIFGRSNTWTKVQVKD